MSVGMLQMLPSLTPIPVIAQVDPEAIEIVEILTRIDGDRVIAAVLVFAVGYGADVLIRRAMKRFQPITEQRRNVARKAVSLGRLGMFLVVGYLALTTLLAGQQTALLGVTGTLGLALGFALKDTVSSLAAGILILVDRPFKVGDRVQFGDIYGEVQEIGLRAVVLRTLARESYSIPNNRFLSEVVISASASRVEMMAAIEFYVGVGEDWEHAREIVYRACATSPYAFLDEPIDVLVSEIARDGAYATVLTAKAYVVDARFENDYRTEVTRRVKRAFRRHRIASPYAREYIVQSPEWRPDALPVGEAT